MLQKRLEKIFGHFFIFWHSCSTTKKIKPDYCNRRVIVSVDSPVAKRLKSQNIKKLDYFRKKNLLKTLLKTFSIKTSAQETTQNKIFDISERNISYKTPFDLICRNCLQYMLYDCLWKNVFISNTVHPPWHMDFLQVVLSSKIFLLAKLLIGVNKL